MSDKTPVDRVLDLLVFAPLGFALAAREQLPEWAEKGRQRVGGQVTVARMFGEFAVRQGRVEAEKALRKAAGQARGMGGRPAPEPAPAPPPAAERPRPRPAPVPDPARPAPTAADVIESIPVTGNGRPTRPPGGGPEVAALAIPGYDTLSASQVVQRLPGLTTEELEAVRAYEAGSRRRKTILNKVDQLRSSA